MGNVNYDLMAGLMELVPGPRCKGEFIKHDEAEYNNLKWNDVRPKPAYADAEKEALDFMRRMIASQINIRTQKMIIREFQWPDEDNNLSSVHMPLDWQFDTKSLYGKKAILSYPYRLKIGENRDASCVYTLLKNEVDIDNFYLAIFSHVKACLDSGRALKDSLKNLTRTGLEEFRDAR